MKTKRYEHFRISSLFIAYQTISIILFKPQSLSYIIKLKKRVMVVNNKYPTFTSGALVVAEPLAMGNPSPVLLRSKAYKFFGKIVMLANLLLANPTSLTQCWLHNKLCS